jgi:acyl transferase domain-containing protein
VSVDTACSSALVALHSGALAIRIGECRSAVASAVGLRLAPQVTLGIAAAGMLSVDGRCKTWDKGANGYVRSEGVGSTVLRAVLDDAPSNLVLSGSAVRQDGRSASLTAPNGSAQRGLLVAAMAVAGLEASAVGGVEAHGTGTALGDPTEAGSMAAAYCNGREAALAVGAAKAGVGHAEAASGMAGLCKVAQQLRRTVVAGNTKLRVLNPLVRERLGAGGAAVLASQPLVSAGGACGLSSFGYSGTIAHALFTAVDISNTPLSNITNLPLARPGRCTLRKREFAWRDPVHPLLQQKLPPLAPALALFRSPLRGPLRTLVAEHIVRGRVVFPGAAYLEMARGAASSALAGVATSAAGGISLSEIFFLRPLMLPDGELKPEDPSWLECAQPQA